VPALPGFERLVDALGDVAGLPRQDRFDGRLVQVEAGIRRGIADAGDDAANDVLDHVVGHRWRDLAEHRAPAPRFITLDAGLARDAGRRRL
jgi:hypothetical protein